LICVIAGKAAAPWDVFSIDWVPSLNLERKKGHGMAADCSETAKQIRKRKYELSDRSESSLEVLVSITMATEPS
jgi:hypothetical protein